MLLFAAVILGGGSQAGVILGAFLVYGLPEFFRDFASARMLIFGLALMIMMIIRPQGILPPRPRRYDVRAFLARRAAGDDVLPQGATRPDRGAQTTSAPNVGEGA